jgi:hypothetical protein
VFVNLFNNVWGTNFQQWIGGSWSSRVRIWATGDNGLEAGLITPGLETRSPAKAVAVTGLGGRLPPMQYGLELSRKGVLVTALGAGGEGILLRLWEQSGQGGVCDVRLPDGFEATEARPCDLRGRPTGSAISVQNGRFQVPMRPFAPVSLIVKTASAS